MVHLDLVPPENITLDESERDNSPFVTEYDVIQGLKKLGHDIRVLGIYDDLKPIRETVEEFEPHIVYNLLEEFDGNSLFDQNVVSYLELLKIAYTGCNPRGLILGRDKALAKKLLSFHRIKTPKFKVYPKNKPLKKQLLPKWLKYPLIVKCLFEEASYGIAKASVVHSDEKLKERLEYIHKNLQTDAIVEEFVEGKEFYVGVLGNYRLKTLPVWELVYENSENPEKEIYSQAAKWNNAYRKRKGVGHKKASLDSELEKKVQTVCKKAYKCLNLNGYARIDLRITSDHQIYILEANPNPNIAKDDEFAKSAAQLKIKYPELLTEIIRLGISWAKTPN